jgi:hypothetical protein
MLYATVREDLKGDGSEAIVMPAVGAHELGNRIIPDSAYPVQVLHQDDNGFVYLLMGDNVVVGQSIDFDYKNIPTLGERETF